MKNTSLIGRAITESLERISSHPFIEATQTGTAAFAQIERWLFCAGRESRIFPHILEGMRHWIANHTILNVISENLEDEYGNGNPQEAHFQHYLKLIDTLGIPLLRFEDYEEGPGITVALEAAKYIRGCGSAGEALGYLLINEAMTPVIYDSVRKGLLALDSCPDTTFFNLHIVTDEHHVAMIYSSLEEVQQGENKAVLNGISFGERAMALLLDEALGRFSCGAAKSSINMSS